MLDDKKRREARQLLEASSIGWMFPIAIGLGFAWGYGMDKLFGTWPWLSAIFAGLGVIAAFINLFRMAGVTDPPDPSPPGSGEKVPKADEGDPDKS